MYTHRLCINGKLYGMLTRGKFGRSYRYALFVPVEGGTSGLGRLIGYSGTIKEAKHLFESYYIESAF